MEKAFNNRWRYDHRSIISDYHGYSLIMMIVIVISWYRENERNGKK